MHAAWTNGASPDSATGAYPVLPTNIRTCKSFGSELGSLADFLGPLPGLERPLPGPTPVTAISKLATVQALEAKSS